MKRLYKFGVYAIASIHHVIAFCLILAPILTIMYQPWYLGFMASVVTVRIMTSRDICILTEIERKWRDIIGEPMNKAYVYHYFIAPIKRMRNKGDSK